MALVKYEISRQIAAKLADRYFLEQCARLGPIDGIPQPVVEKPIAKIIHHAPEREQRICIDFEDTWDWGQPDTWSEYWLISA